MRYKNSIKIVFSNFNIVWKSMLYFLLVAIGIGAILYFAIAPIYELLREAGFVLEVLEVYTNFLTSLNLSNLLLAAKDLGEGLITILTTNISTIWFNFVVIAVDIGFFIAIFNNLSIVPMCNSLNYYMGSINNYGFYSSFQDTVGKSLKITLIQYFVSLPIDILIGFVFVVSLKLFNASWWLISFLAPFLIMFILIVMLALKCTLFVSWIPTMVTMNYSVWRSLGVAIKTSFKHFGRVFGTSVGVVLTIIVLNLFLGLFTFGVGFLVSIPTSFLLYSAYGMVITFEGLGMRYYVDVYNVVAPLKKEKTDRFEDMRYIV